VDLVDHHQVPVCGSELLVDVFVTAELVEAAGDEGVLEEPI